jgi:hypothetical protein
MSSYRYIGTERRKNQEKQNTILDYVFYNSRYFFPFSPPHFSDMFFLDFALKGKVEYQLHTSDNNNKQLHSCIPENYIFYLSPNSAAF